MFFSPLAASGVLSACVTDKEKKKASPEGRKMISNEVVYPVRAPKGLVLAAFLKRRIFFRYPQQKKNLLEQTEGKCKLV